RLGGRDTLAPMVNWSGVLRRARSAARWWVLGTVAAHGAAIATVLTVDRMRKRRYPPGGEFPRTPPRSVPVADSEVTVFTYGQHVYDAILASIREAQHTIYFETFIWKSDEIGQAFKDELVAAAERGVDVYIVVDTWGNLVVDPRFKRMPDLPGLHSVWFPLIRPGLVTLNPRKSGRDHRKILVVVPSGLARVQRHQPGGPPQDPRGGLGGGLRGR